MRKRIGKAFTKRKLSLKLKANSNTAHFEANRVFIKKSFKLNLCYIGHECTCADFWLRQLTFVWCTISSARWSNKKTLTEILRGKSVLPSPGIEFRTFWFLLWHYLVYRNLAYLQSITYPQFVHTNLWVNKSTVKVTNKATKNCTPRRASVQQLQYQLPGPSGENFIHKVWNCHYLKLRRIIPFNKL